MPEDKNEIDIKFSTPPQSGRTPIKLVSISKFYGDKKFLKKLILKLKEVKNSFCRAKRRRENHSC
jgi:hypothetical protein